jgi:uncharacterized protein YcfL
MADKLLKYDVAMKSTKTVWQMETPRCYTGDENTVTFDFNITDLEAADLVGVIPNVYLYMRDGSFFQNGPADGVEITGTIVNYTMKGNEGKHSGIARAQLVLVWDDEINPPEKLTSQLYDFEVVSGLENKVAVEVMIQDWTTLTREARTFIDTSSDEVDALKGELQTAINTANASLGEFDVALETGIVAANLAEKLEDFEEINNSRLLSTERQLAETIKKGGVKKQDLDKSSDSYLLDFDNFNETTRSTLLGLTPGQINAVIGRDNVTAENAAFLVKSTNLFDKNKIEAGYAIDTTGVKTPNASYSISDYLPVTPNTIYSTSKVNYISFFTGNRVFISRTGASADELNHMVRTTPSNAQLIVLVIQNQQLNNAQLNVGSALAPYESYFTPYLSESVALRPKSISNRDIGEKAVDISNTNFVDRSSNRFNAQTILSGHALDSAGYGTEGYGKAIPNGGYDVSEFISVLPNKTYTHNGYRIFWYDEDKKGISTSTNKTETIPSNATFVRLVILTGTADTTQLNESPTLLPYEPYYIKIDNAEIKQDELNKDDVVELSSNRFNAKSVLKGRSLNPILGENYGKPVLNGYDVSEFISVLPNKTYTHNAVRIFWYDEDKNAISTSTNKTITVPSNAQFVRLTINIGTADTTQLNESSELLPYEPYYIKIDNVELKQEELNKNDLSDKDFYVERLRRVFESPEMEDASHISTKSANDMHLLWDGLMSSNDTKTKIATDAQGNDLFKYHFKIPTTMLDENVKLKKPKMVLIGGTHGNEKAAAWTLYTSMKMIIEDWKTDEILESLRWGVEFVIVPIANPSGWNANTRKNGNGIDINRQFPTKWTQFEVDHTTYGGEAPLTEPEAIAINSIIETEEDVIYFGDFHNFGSNTDNFMWNAGGTLFSYNIGESLVSSLSNHWKKVIPALANDGKDYYGYVSDTPVGSMALHAPKRGLQASTIEIGSVFFNETAEFSGESIKRGVEVFVNWLTLNHINNIKFYNNR